MTRSVSTSSVHDGNSSKRPRDETAASADFSENSEMLNKIQQMFEASNAKIEAKIDASISRVEQRITCVEKQFSSFRLDCTDNINKLAAAVTEVRVGLTSTAQRLDRLEKSNDLLISGVPYVANESLQQLFRNLSTCLAYSDTDMPLVDLRRLSRLPITTGSSPPIVCQFAIRNARDEFFRRYLKTRNLSLRNVGFDSDQRVYMNENLTPHARNIRTEAIKMKKDGVLLKVFTRNGVVYIQRREGSEAEPITDINYLKAASSLNLSS